MFGGRIPYFITLSRLYLINVSGVSTCEIIKKLQTIGIFTLFSELYSFSKERLVFCNRTKDNMKILKKIQFITKIFKKFKLKNAITLFMVNI